MTEDKKELLKAERSDNLYAKFQKLLDDNGTTAYKVAKAINVPPSTFYNWKRGLYTPKVDKLKLIADYFGVPVTYFIE